MSLTRILFGLVIFAVPAVPKHVFADRPIICQTGLDSSGKQTTVCGPGSSDDGDDHGGGNGDGPLRPCKPQVNCDLACGLEANGCGGQIDCGDCASGFTCRNNTCVNLGQCREACLERKLSCLDADETPRVCGPAYTECVGQC